MKMLFLDNFHTIVIYLNILFYMSIIILLHEKIMEKFNPLSFSASPCTINNFCIKFGTVLIHVWIWTVHFLSVEQASIALLKVIATQNVIIGSFNNAENTNF